jgi:LPS-assembly lipoprotein
MSKRYLHVFMLICLTLSLTACGFHLRGTDHLPPTFNKVYIDSQSPYDTFTLTLTQLLKSMNIQLVTSAEKAPVTLKVFDKNLTTSVLSESASSSTKQYILHLAITYQLQNAQGAILYGPKTLHNQRDFTVNENQVLSTDAHQQMLSVEMERDAVFMLLMQLGSPEVATALNKTPEITPVKP